MAFYLYQTPIDPVSIKESFNKSLNHFNLPDSYEIWDELFRGLNYFAADVSNEDGIKLSCPFPLVHSVKSAKSHAKKIKKVLSGENGPSLGKCQQLLAHFYGFGKWDFFTKGVSEFEDIIREVTTEIL